MAQFRDRHEAGLVLADALRPVIGAVESVVILGIPRGGVPVAAVVAGALGASFDIVVVRKLRAPFQPELGFGAIAADGHVEVDEDSVRRFGLSEGDIAAEVADRRAVVGARLAAYREVLPPPDLAGAVAVIVDDGIATGGTVREAAMFARRQGAARVVAAAPVGPPGVERRLAGAADAVVVPHQPGAFTAVGQAYDDFAPVEEAQVLETLRAVASARGLSA
jgi:putative phosphoribosyl transferase